MLQSLQLWNLLIMFLSIIRFPGLKEVCLVSGCTDIAFIEYESDSLATQAMSALQDFRIAPTSHENNK